MTSPPPPRLPSPAVARWSSQAVDIPSFTYTSCYCEENVYLLCKNLIQMGLADPNGLDLFVAFVSNELKQVPIWHQKTSKLEDGFVLWDYHVICIQLNRNRGEGTDHLVWDLDSSLPVPSPLRQYLSEAIRPSPLFSVNYRRLFRVIHSPLFFRFFASDRSHMKDSLGSWISPPPKYNPFVSEDGTLNNLHEYIQITPADVTTNVDDCFGMVFSDKLGLVVDETQLENLFCRIECRVPGLLSQ